MFTRDTLASMFMPKREVYKEASPDPFVRYYEQMKEAAGAQALAETAANQAKQIENLTKELEAFKAKPQGFAQGAKAGWGSMKTWAGKSMPYLGIAGGLAGAGFLADYAIDSLKERKVEKEFESALSKVKSDREIKQLNPQVVQNYYDALKIYAPDVAMNPNLAKDFILSSTGNAQFNAVDSSRLTEMAKLRPNNNQGRPQTSRTESMSKMLTNLSLVNRGE